MRARGSLCARGLRVTRALGAAACALNIVRALAAVRTLDTFGSAHASVILAALRTARALAQAR